MHTYITMMSMKFCFVFVLLLLIQLVPLLCAAEESTVLDWGFIGEGFHMQFFVEFDGGNPNTLISFNLSNSFFIDAAEAEQLYTIVHCPLSGSKDFSSRGDCEERTSSYNPLSLTTAYLCDIEAPVFRVPGDNEINIRVTPKMPSKTKGRATLIFPIHARYEHLDREKPFSLFSFIFEEDAYVHRCMNEIVSSSAVYTSVDSDVVNHCRNIPVGVLNDLPFVYRTLMSLLVAGAILVIASLSF